jgi:ribosomal protein S18 acetylase RimI-like enzyme
MTRTHQTNDHEAEIAGGQTGVIRKAVAEDLPGMVTIHRQAFSHFFLTQLGGEFLLRYYRLVLNYRAGIALVSEGRGALEGFVCGFVDPAEFYSLMWRNGRLFVAPALSALVRHPSLTAKVLHGVQRIQTPAAKGPTLSCELSSIAVAPEAGGSGLGKALMQAFLAQAWSMDAQCVYLTTDADGNEGANALYRKVGFQLTRRFLQRKGRWMNEYLIHRMGAGDSCGVCP